MNTKKRPLGRPSYTVSLVDREGHVQYQSSAVEVLLGYTPDEVAGSEWLSYVHRDDVQPVQAQFQDLVTSGREQARWVLRFRAARGGWQPVEVRARNLLGDPDVEGVLLCLRTVGGPRDRGAMRAETKARAGEAAR